MFTLACAQAGMVIGPWTPIFKGIEHAVGTNFPDGVIPRLQVVHCLRVNLADPDVQLHTGPQASGYIAESRETLSLSTSNFLKQQGVAVAINANFYIGPGGTTDPGSEGLPMEVSGLQISKGVIVSAADSSTSDGFGRYCSFLFTTNKQSFIVWTNTPPGTNTAGIYTAFTGFYPLVMNGVNVGNNATSHIPNPNPRTALGISQNRSNLFMITIDGRQPGYSEGAIDEETGAWLLAFGAWNAVNMDGGGSTTMVQADACGNPFDLNRSSYIPQSGRERFIGSHLGVYAAPLANSSGFINSVAVSPWDTTATITWTTQSPATGQVSYGPTAALGSTTPLESTPGTSHVATLNGLTPGGTYFYQITANVGATQHTLPCVGSLVTSNFGITTASAVLFDVTNSWKYFTNNLDGINWSATNYNDVTWTSGIGLFYIEANGSVAPRNTFLPPSVNGSPQTLVPAYPTYYFRTHFTFTNNPANVTLIFSNYVDDGAVFYLNGVEVQRLRMAPAPTVISYTDLTLNGAFPCGGDATCPDVFTIFGTAGNLHTGDNVLAVEVHQFSATSTDVVFGSALSYSAPTVISPTLHLLRSGNSITLYWNGSGYTLQKATQFINGSNTWSNVAGPITNSTYTIQNPVVGTFYRLIK